MAQQGDSGHQQGRERLWLSPHCLQSQTTNTAVTSIDDLFGF